MLRNEGVGLKMIYLLLAITSSVLVSTVLRFGEEKIENNMAMFVANYAICALLSRFYMGNQSLIPNEEGMGFAIGLGVISGILYLASFVLLQTNIRKNGVALASTFMKLGVLIPTLMALFLFHEIPKITQLAGIGLVVAAILMMNLDKEDNNKSGYRWLLLVLLVVSGTTDSTVNIFDKLGNVVLKDHFLFLNFVMAGICAIVFWVIQKLKICKWDILYGICVGFPNYYSSRFLLLALHQLPAVIAYPVYSVAGIAVLTILSVVLFKEKLSKQKLGGIAIIALALVLLN